MILSESDDGKNICLECEDGSKFSFPVSDCAKLPITHSSAEELSHYLWFKMVNSLGVECLLSRGITVLEISLAEAPGQAAVYRRQIPANAEELVIAEKTPIIRHQLQVRRCL